MRNIITYLQIVFSLIAFLFVAPATVYGCAADIDCPTGTFCCRPSNIGLKGSCYDLNTQLCCRGFTKFIVCNNLDATCTVNTTAATCTNPTFTSASAIPTSNAVTLSWVFTGTPDGYFGKISTTEDSSCTEDSQNEQYLQTKTSDKFTNYLSGGSRVNFLSDTLYYYRIRAHYAHGTNICGRGSFNMAAPVLFPIAYKQPVRMKVFIDDGAGGEETAGDGLLNGTEPCYNGNVTLSIAGTGAPGPITYNPNEAPQVCFGGLSPCSIPAYCNKAKIVYLSSQTSYTLTLSPPSPYVVSPSSGYIVTLDSTNPFDSCTATPPPARCTYGDVEDANFALQLPPIDPWIQTTEGDVHSNTGITTPGGP